MYKAEKESYNLMIICTELRKVIIRYITNINYDNILNAEREKDTNIRFLFTELRSKIIYNTRIFTVFRKCTISTS